MMGLLTGVACGLGYSLLIVGGAAVIYFFALTAVEHLAGSESLRNGWGNHEDRLQALEKAAAKKGKRNVGKV